MRWLILLATAAALVAGCSAKGPSADEKVLQSWPDAEKKYSNQTDTTHHASYAFKINAGNHHIQVEAAYRTNDRGSFVLSDPAGNGAKIQTLTGASTLNNPHWFERNDPEVGTWHLSVDLPKGGVYAFGVEL